MQHDEEGKTLLAASKQVPLLKTKKEDSSLGFQERIWERGRLTVRFENGCSTHREGKPSSSHCCVCKGVAYLVITTYNEYQLKKLTNYWGWEQGPSFITAAEVHVVLIGIGGCNCSCRRRCLPSVLAVAAVVAAVVGSCSCSWACSIVILVGVWTFSILALTCIACRVAEKCKIASVGGEGINHSAALVTRQ